MYTNIKIFKKVTYYFFHLLNTLACFTFPFSNCYLNKDNRQALSIRNFITDSSLMSSYALFNDHIQ